MFVFLLKSTVCLSLLFGLYKMLLGHTTFFRANHATLLLITLLSVVIPLIKIPATEATAVGYIEGVIISSGYAGISTTGNSSGSLLTWQNAFVLLYLLGAAVCLLLIIRSALKITLFIKRTRAFRKEDDFTLLLSEDASLSPYSFGRYIIMSREDYEQNGEAILAHELCHVRRHHSLSVMLMNILSAALWLNPIVWLVREELLLVCEYEADMAVINNGFEAKKYQLLLIKKAVSPSRYTIANSLNHSSLKKRLTMMRKTKSNRWAQLGYGAIAMAAALAIPAFANKDLISPIENTLNENLVEELKSENADKVTKKRAESQEKTEVSSAQASETDFNAAVIAEKSASAQVADEEKAKGETLAVSESKQKATQQIAATQAKPEAKPQDVKTVADKMPEYEGGILALMKFMMENIKYPEQAAKEKKQGNVVVQFTVTTEGKVEDVNVVRRIDPELDAEAVRVVSLTSGHWTPGESLDKKVNCKFTIPVNFKLQ